MSVEHYHERHKATYGTITVPLPGVEEHPGQRSDLDQKIAVTPVTDAWLVSPERSWEQVDQVLEGRITDLQRAFQTPRRTSPMPSAPESYGLERPVDMATARVLAYVDLLDEYNWQTSGHLAIAEGLREAFDQERTNIKATARNQGIAQKRIREAGEARYNTPLAKNTAEAQEAQGVQNLILRKAVMELFHRDVGPTQSPLVLDNFPKVIEDAKTFLEASSHQSNLQKRKPVDHFIESLATHLSTTQDKELFKRYRYKNTSGLVRTAEDAAVLQTGLRFALESDTIDVSDESREQLRHLGHAYFDFLKNRAWRLSLEQQGSFSDQSQEKYPLLSFLYDTTSTAFYRGVPTVLQGLPEILDRNFTHRLNSKTGKKQMENCMLNWEQIALPTRLLLKDNLILLPHHSDDIEYLNENIPELVEFMTSDEHRLWIGMYSLNSLMNKPSTTNLTKSFAVAAAARQLAKYYDSVLKTVDKYTEGYMADVIQKIAYPSLYRANGIMVDFINFTHSNIVDISLITNDRVFSRDVVVLKELAEKAEGPQFEAHVLNRFMFSFLTNNGEIAPNAEKENHYLWDEVLNNPRWFVSPRGDRYRASRDAELADAAIDSLTFRIDKRFPREHKIEMQIQGFEQPWQFWLDTNRNLLNKDREPLISDYRYKEVLTNLLLKRLYVITSGKLAEEQGPPPDEEGVEAYPIAFRRAHYVFLNSTDTRPITMESPGARIHADEIREEYGIDIYGEIRRRRQIGTLAPNQYLTFRREHAEFLEGSPVPIPNELTYDPSLVQIPAA